MAEDIIANPCLKQIAQNEQRLCRAVLEITLQGLQRGWLGAIAAWLGFTLPSAVALILFALGISEWAALAQEAAINDDRDIVVTASKREQNLQDVPLAITAPLGMMSPGPRSRQRRASTVSGSPQRVS